MIVTYNHFHFLRFASTIVTLLLYHPLKSRHLPHKSIAPQCGFIVVVTRWYHCLPMKTQYFWSVLRFVSTKYKFAFLNVSFFCHCYFFVLLISPQQFASFIQINVFKASFLCSLLGGCEILKICLLYINSYSTCTSAS